MAYIMGPVKVGVAPLDEKLCPKLRFNGYLFTDAVASDAHGTQTGADLNIFRLEGANHDDWVATGFYGGECWVEVLVTVRWSFPPFSTRTATLWIVDNGNAASVIWQYDFSTHGDSGSEILSPEDISAFGACGGQLRMDFFGSDNSDNIEFEITGFTVGGI